MIDAGTWTCHVCGAERPDRLISVERHERELAPGIPVTENVRYCNDRQGCREGARDVTFLPAQHGRGPTA